MISQMPPKPPRIYAEPTSLEDAQARHRALVYDINVIQMQLGDDTRKDRMGAEFASWKMKAMGARLNKVDELMFLKDWIKARRAALQIGLQADRSDPTSLIAAARNVLLNLKRDGVELDKEEIAVLDALDAYCMHLA
jgi:hypothetical protein